ncbi:hypothetical protein GSI_06298 [Ganoderma sinense ZZ0214-1]|uniref:Pre-rRNA-processing protein n=1 Tax=Ganoderma sinense ZZ0214-1 TaxID=1077348 RepID=A0A2G8SCU6_9APHY|nr:hypothetical protein GSI_06298 [Ganoderma sinense ZZ0214-1]
MPKSTKKKKDKAADFTKAKLKLGKGKQTPSNVVDTSFKARSIALPTQKIAVEKDEDAPSTKRKLTFDALLVHLKHYNASTRKDAVLGLRELLETHPQLTLTHLTPLINGCDASVRKALLSFFSWLFRQVSRDTLAPHSPVLLLFTTSAQTHIFPEIRIDAVRFLDIYLEYIPEVTIEGWMHPGGGSHGSRVMEGYLGILNAGMTFGEGGDTGPVQATSTASVVLSPTSKLVVLRSFESFLAHAASSSWNAKGTIESSAGRLTTPTWYLSSSFASTSAFDAFDGLLEPKFPSNGGSLRLEDDRMWSPEGSEHSEENFVGKFSLATDPCWPLHDVTDLDDAVAILRQEGRAGLGNDVEIVCTEHLARTLHPTLVSTFLDCAPTVFSPSSSPPETELHMVTAVCRICRTLYGRLLQDTAESGTAHHSAEMNLQTILSYLSPYFPFASTAPNVRRDMKAEQTFQDLNLIFCELSSSLLLVSQRTTAHRPSLRNTPRPGRSGGSELTSTPVLTTHSRQIERISAYIMQLLQGQSPAPSQSLPRPITPQAYIALLPTIWSLANSPRLDVSEPSSSIFSVVVDHAIRASSTSAVKRHTVDFIGRLLLLNKEPEYMGHFEASHSPEHGAKLEEWVLQLPRTLWELGTNHLATTETIVRLLLRLAQRRSRLLQPSTFAALRSRLLPYFSITHPTRGKLPGPYAKLPVQSPLRRLVLDLVSTIVAQGYRTSNMDDGLEVTVSEAVQGTPEASYWAGVLARDH